MLRLALALVLAGDPAPADENGWLRAGPEDRAVRRHLAAENRRAAALMRPHARLQRQLAREIEARAYVDHVTAPVRRGAWSYFTRTSRRTDHPVHLRRRGEEAPQVVLDVEALARHKKFLELDVFEPSDDGRYLAYSTDEVGDEEYTLFVKDLSTGEIGPDRLRRVTSAAWGADGSELLYTVRDDAHRSHALYAHRRGDVGPDRLVYAERDDRFDLGVARSRSGEWFILTADSYEATEVQVARADRPGRAWTTIAARAPGHLYDVDHSGDSFYVRSNLGAPNFHVMRAPEHDPRPALWKELVPARADVAITSVDAFVGHLVLGQRERGLARVEIHELATGNSFGAGELDLRTRGAAFTRGLAGVWAGENPDPNARRFRVHVESPHEPMRTVDIELADGREVLVDQAPGGPCGGTARELGTARAADGTEITFLRFAGSGSERPRSVLLEAYGAYGSVYDPDHLPERCALLDRGVDLVIAWVRGGGEFGEPWHAAATVRERPTASGDLIAVAERLISGGLTTRERLVIAGESAGGALMAAAVNTRPELFAAAVLRVPFLDVLGTMSDPSAPLTTIEYAEWGDPRVADQRAVMAAWCPYTNLAARDYPAILVESSLADSRVAYHEQARYVARLRARGRGGPFLLRTEFHAGHGGATSRRAWLRSRAFEAAFILTRSGRVAR